MLADLLIGVYIYRTMISLPMSVEAKDAALGGVRPMLPEVGRAVAGESLALDRRRRDGRAYDPGKLPRWREGLVGLLEKYEQKQAEAAPEQAYIAAGRKAKQAVHFTQENAQSAQQSMAATQSETAVASVMNPGRRAALAYERVSGALLPVPLALGRGISLAV
jgi:hypothetical protein